MINGSVQDISCQTPVHCFLPDSEPTCLVMPYCDCRLIRDSPQFQYGSWKLIKGIVEFFNSSKSGKYPNDVRDFSVKHLLFLLGFVIAPLACWCLLNFINENKCSWKNRNANVETVPISAESRASRSAISSFGTSPSESRTTTCGDLSVSQAPYTPAELHCNPAYKQTCPPSYDEATYPDYESESPPPSYADVVFEQEQQVQQLVQTMLVIHPGQGDEV